VPEISANSYRSIAALDDNTRRSSAVVERGRFFGDDVDPGGIPRDMVVG
jgi:hypothetical protein